MSSSSKNLLDNLKRLRKRHAFTQEQVAELSGIDYKFYQSIEAGRRPNVTLMTLDQLAKVYQVSAQELIGVRLPVTTVKPPQASLGAPTKVASRLKSTDKKSAKGKGTLPKKPD